MDINRFRSRWIRWHTCSLCEQEYHGVVNCALGWACWKTYLGRPEEDRDRIDAMTGLGNGLSEARQYEDALSVKEAMLSSLQRLKEALSGSFLGREGPQKSTPYPGFKLEFKKHIPAIFVTSLDTFQLFSGWLKDLAPSNS